MLGVSGFGVVGGGWVEGDGPDETVVDEDGGVGVVGVDDCCVAGPGCSNPGSCSAADADDSGSVDLGAGALRGPGQGDAEVDCWWGGRPPLGWGGPADAAVGAAVVVVVDEGVELGLQFAEIGGQGLAAQPFLEGVLEPFDFPAGLGVVGAAGFGDHTGGPEVAFEA